MCGKRLRSHQSRRIVFGGGSADSASVRRCVRNNRLRCEESRRDQDGEWERSEGCGQSARSFQHLGWLAYARPNASFPSHLRIVVRPDPRGVHGHDTDRQSECRRGARDQRCSKSRQRHRLKRLFCRRGFNRAPRLPCRDAGQTVPPSQSLPCRSWRLHHERDAPPHRCRPGITGSRLTARRCRL